MKAKAVVTNDDQRIANQIRQALLTQGVDCPLGHLVPLDSLLDRAGVLRPDVAVVVLPAEPREGLPALRETRNALPSLHVVVVGPATDPKLILDALKQGADEYLDLASLETELAGVLERLQNAAAVHSGELGGGKVIAILSPSGGSGASTLAAGLSSLLAKEHQACGLIDLRLGVGDQAAMFDLRPSRTLAGLCQNVARLDSSLFEQFLIRHANGVWLLPAPILGSEIAQVTDKGVRRAIILARQRFPYVVLDMGSVVGDVEREAFWQADLILLIARLDYTSVRNSRRLLETLAELGIQDDRIRLILNGCGQSGQLEVEQAETAVGKKVAHQLPYDASSVNLAINNGRPELLQRRFGRITRSIRGLAVSVNGAKHEAPRT